MVYNLFHSNHLTIFVLIFAVMISISILIVCDNLDPLSPFGKVTLTIHDYGYRSTDVSPAIVFESEFKCPIFSPWGVESGFIDVESSGYEYDYLGRRIAGEKLITTSHGIIYCKYSIEYNSTDLPIRIIENRRYNPGQKHYIDIFKITWERFFGKWELTSYSAQVDGFNYEYQFK